MTPRGSTGAARTCPVCGTPDARPIVYGMPTVDLFEDPEIELGGCVIESGSPAYRCRNAACAHAFGHRRR